MIIHVLCISSAPITYDAFSTSIRINFNDIFWRSFSGYSTSSDFSRQPWSAASSDKKFIYNEAVLLSTGSVILGTVIMPDIDLSKPISLTDTFAIPAVSKPVMIAGLMMIPTK